MDIIKQTDELIRKISVLDTLMKIGNWILKNEKLKGNDFKTEFIKFFKTL